MNAKIRFDSRFQLILLFAFLFVFFCIISFIPEGSFIAWDAHYLANEGMVSKSSLISDNSLKLVKAYQPGDSTTTLGGYNYELLIFLKDSKFSN